jgi:hypothetical protein
MIQAIKRFFELSSVRSPYWSIRKPIEFTRLFQKFDVVEKVVPQPVSQHSWLSRFDPKRK